MSMLVNIGKRYRAQKKLIDSGKAGNPEYVLKSMEAVVEQARSFQNLDRPQAIIIANKALDDCELALEKYRKVDDVDMIFEINAIKSEIHGFLTNFSVEEIDRALHKSDGDSYLDKARKELILAKKVKNIKRHDSVVYALFAIKSYDDALIFFRQENISRRDIAEAEKKEAEEFLSYFTDDEIADAKKSVLKGKGGKGAVSDIDGKIPIDL
ncbi:MAG: hypothetical protein KAJ56_02780 [Candidatus Aenigmarchaeota archaeon]|nr:hypothetical protein [Candidatus Aenigmarchaeota archaeon]